MTVPTSVVSVSSITGAVVTCTSSETAPGTILTLTSATCAVESVKPERTTFLKPFFSYSIEYVPTGSAETR